MVKVTYVEHDGTKHDVDVDTGLTLMEGARDNNVPGIEGDCGGACACSTCHAYFTADWYGRIGPMDDMEEEMLDFAFDPQPGRSRLTCQITVTEEMEGLEVQLPERQI